ncbi:MAG: hypothetical protein ACE5JK_03925 [Candidatus Omnitrophota bacterium]
MKKKYVIILALVLLFTWSQLFVGFAAERLVADLEVGALGSASIGQPFTSVEDLDEAIGAKVDSIDDSAWDFYIDDDFVNEFYAYHNEGLSVTVTYDLTGETETVEIDSFHIMIKAGDTFEGTYFQVFKGTFSPSLPENAGLDAITGVFGEPETEESEEGLTLIAYRKRYGVLSFLLRDDTLIAVSMHATK